MTASCTTASLFVDESEPRLIGTVGEDHRVVIDLTELGNPLSIQLLGTTTEIKAWMIKILDVLPPPPPTVTPAHLQPGSLTAHGYETVERIRDDLSPWVPYFSALDLITQFNNWTTDGDVEAFAAHLNYEYTARTPHDEQQEALASLAFDDEPPF